MSEAWYKKGPCFCCAPTLCTNEKHSDGSRLFQKSCALVLVALGDDDWWGRYLLDKEETAVLLKEVEEVSKKKRGMFANRDDNHITLVELRDFATDEENKEKILKHSSALHGLARVEFIEQVFSEYDTDGSHGLDSDEWEQLVDKLARMNLEFLLGLAFVNFRAFFGRYQTWDLHPEDFDWDVIQQDLIKAAGSFGRNCGLEAGSAAADESSQPLLQIDDKLPKFFQVGFDPDCEGWNPFPPGWWKDFHYYSANNHPLHGILMCSPVHPLSWVERFWMEIATIGFTTLTGVLQDRWVLHNKYPEQLAFLHNPFMFSLVLVTIPGMMIWWTLFLLFTCKSGHINKASSTPAEERSAWKKRTFAATVGYILCVLGLMMLLWFCTYFHYTTINAMWPYYRLVIVGRIKSYIICSGLALFLYFNPVIAWGTTDPEKPQLGLGDLVGLGQWRIEKQRFQVRCISVANKRKTRRHTDRGLEAFDE